MARDAKESLKWITDKIEKIFKDAVAVKELQAIGDEAVKIVQRRARLGYGSPPDAGGQRFSFPALSPGYVKFRQTTGRDYLSDTTTARKSNVTFTGQMLDSLKVVSVRSGNVAIAPTGVRKDRFSPAGLTNRQVASYLADQGRTFLALTEPEISQLVRFYRTRFGDLVSRRT